jgi:hypothetical protein
LRSTTTGTTVCLRQKTSNCRVNPAARAAAKPLNDALDSDPAGYLIASALSQESAGTDPGARRYFLVVALLDRKRQNTRKKRLLLPAKRDLE